MKKKKKEKKMQYTGDVTNWLDPLPELFYFYHANINHCFEMQRSDNEHYLQLSTLCGDKLNQL